MAVGVGVAAGLVDQEQVAAAVLRQEGKGKRRFPAGMTSERKRTSGEEGVGLAFGAYGGGGAMACDDFGVVGEGEEAGVDAVEELASVTAGEVGASYRAGEEGVAREQEVLVGEVDAEAAFGVAGGVKDLGVEVAYREDFIVGGGVVRGCDFRRGDTEPGGLLVHDGDEGGGQPGCRGSGRRWLV